MSEIPRGKDEPSKELEPEQLQEIGELRDKLKPLRDKHWEMTKALTESEDITQEQYDELMKLQAEIEEIAARIIEIKKREN